MAGSTPIGALLLGLSLVLLLPVAHAQEGLRLGGCPSSYITTFDFDARKISEMIGSTGYQTIMIQGTGAEENTSCQKLQLFDGTAFSYSYMDAAGERQQVSGRYRAVPTSFRTQGFLELFGLPIGVLGANIFGIAHLYPLVSRADAQVYLSCSQIGFFHSENVYTFVLNTPASLRGADEIREILALMGVPHSKTLRRTDQTCVKPEPPANDSSNGTSALDTPSSEGAASTVSTSAPSALDSPSSEGAASNVSTSAPSALDSPSSEGAASNVSTSANSTLDSPSSEGAASNVSTSATSASDASLSGPAASDASSSNVLPSGASSNDALTSVASSIDALASDALSSDASSQTALSASESNAVEDGPQEASSEVGKEEPAIESSVDQDEAS